MTFSRSSELSAEETKQRIYFFDYKGFSGTHVSVLQFGPTIRTFLGPVTIHPFLTQPLLTYMRIAHAHFQQNSHKT